MIQTAGPTLRALLAARIDRDLRLNAGTSGGVSADRGRPGMRDARIGDIRSVATNEVDDAQSRLSWEVAHPLWRLRFQDRRTRGEGGGFVRTAPQLVSLDGDLLDAARFLEIGRDQFFAAVRADGWSRADVTVQRLRWLDAPSARDGSTLQAMMRLL